jgi:hypothetical protein
MNRIINALSILICIVALIGCKDKTNSSQVTQNAEPNVSEANDLSSREATADVPSGEAQHTADVQLLVTVRAAVKTYVDAGLSLACPRELHT